MHEQRRQAYLQAMGINHYVPRFVLPNALASPRCETFVADMSAMVVESVAAQEPQTAPPSPASPAARAPKIEVEFAAKKPVPPRPVKDEVITEPRFTAELVLSDLGILFIASGNLSGAQKRLVANIAQAYSTFALEGRDPALQAGRFQWPVSQGRSLPRGEAAAKDALSANVLARSERQKLNKIVIFGDTLQPYLDEAMLTTEELKIIKSASLEELMSDGNAKAALWQALRTTAQS